MVCSNGSFFVAVSLVILLLCSFIILPDSPTASFCLITLFFRSIYDGCIVAHWTSVESFAEDDRIVQHFIQLQLFSKECSYHVELHSISHLLFLEG